MVFDYDAPQTIRGMRVVGANWRGTRDESGRYTATWPERGVRMQPGEAGRWSVNLPISPGSATTDWRWGVDLVLENGETVRFAVADNTALRFSPAAGRAHHSYAGYERNGGRRMGDDVSFRYWAPTVAARGGEVVAKVQLADGTWERVPMTPDPEHPEYWIGRSEGGWERMANRPYLFELPDENGNPIDRVDPYAIRLQGEQRSTRRFYVDVANRRDAHQFVPGREELLWFNVDDSLARGADELFVVLKDEAGRPLSAGELRARIGRTFDGSIIREIRKNRFDDFWLSGLQDDGRIRMAAVGGAFSTLIPNLPALTGLRYEIRDAAGSLVGDRDGDGRLSQGEAEVSPNDPWSNVITDRTGLDNRAGILSELPSVMMASRVDESRPLPPLADPREAKIYQLHPTSFLSAKQHTNVTTMDDIMRRLDYIQSLGCTDIQLQPITDMPGLSWGYEGHTTLAAEEGLGFMMREPDGNERWVCGAEAIAIFNREARRRGIAVTCDLVFNHLFESFANRWQHDGSAANIFFNRADWNSSKPIYFETPWGIMPNLEHPAVREFFKDIVLYHALELGFTGFRFDFTQPIIDAGHREFLQELMVMLEKIGIDRRIAENFPLQDDLTRPVGEGGVGFTRQLYVDANHTIVDHDRNPAIIARAALRGNGEDLAMDRLVACLTNPPPGGWGRVVLGMTTHDEVGQGTRGVVAASGWKTPEFPDQFARNVARALQVLTMTAPGNSMLFMGEEAQLVSPNNWGRAATWSGNWNFLEVVDSDMDLTRLRMSNEDKERWTQNLESPSVTFLSSLTAAQRQAFEYVRERRESRDVNELFCDLNSAQAVTAHRALAATISDHASLRFADARPWSGYVHNADGVAAIGRTLDETGDTTLTIVNLSREERADYRGKHEPLLPPGVWEVVHNSDEDSYGGTGGGSRVGTRIEGGRKDVRGLDLPLGGALVLRLVR